MAEFYKLKSTTNTGQPFNFETLQGKVVLVVNTASKCGFTPQYTTLQRLHLKYKDQGLMVLGFPCDQFGGQEPASDEKVAEFCQLHYGVDFQLMQKSDVNGDNANEVFQYLKSQRSSFGLTRIKWNFEKFLIDRHGNVVSRRFSMRGPTGMEADIQKLLAEQP